MEKPLILVTNDDGIQAKGIRELIEAVKDIGYVVVVAPESPQSSTGHAVTVTHPLRIKKTYQNNGVEEYACNGKPVDCVKIAEQVILKKKPDLIVSGINHGANCSVNVLYSGTMAAAIEGTIIGVPSIGFSLFSMDEDADFSPYLFYVKEISKNVLENGLPDGITLNVNFPVLKSNEIKGVRLCRQARARWIEEFDKRSDPIGNDYYWLTGSFKLLDDGEDTDIWALKNGYISVVPTGIDLTSHDHIKLFDFDKSKPNIYKK